MKFSRIMMSLGVACSIFSNINLSAESEYSNLKLKEIFDSKGYNEMYHTCGDVFRKSEESISRLIKMIKSSDDKKIYFNLTEKLFNEIKEVEAVIEKYENFFKKNIKDLTIEVGELKDTQEVEVRLEAIKCLKQLILNLNHYGEGSKRIKVEYCDQAYNE